MASCHNKNCLSSFDWKLLSFFSFFTISQSQISKIEKGIIYPSSILLYQLSERLGLDPNYIFALTKNKKIKYIENVKCVMRDCVKQKQYNELYE
ncbi:helix-turn-helix domain-containing protein, partial [Bacillus sp. D-CC]